MKYIMKQGKNILMTVMMGGKLLSKSSIMYHTWKASMIPTVNTFVMRTQRSQQSGFIPIGLLIILILFMIWIYFLWSLDHCGEIIVLSSIWRRSLSPLTYYDFLLCSCRSITLRSAVSSSRAQDFSFGLLKYRWFPLNSLQLASFPS